MKKFILFALLMALVLLGSRAVAAEKESWRVISFVNGYTKLPITEGVVTLTRNGVTISSAPLTPEGLVSVFIASDYRVNIVVPGYAPFDQPVGNETAFGLWPEQPKDFLVSYRYQNNETKGYLLPLGYEDGTPARGVYVVPINGEISWTSKAREQLEKGAQMITDSTTGSQVYAVVDESNVPIGSVVIRARLMRMEYDGGYYENTRNKTGLVAVSCNIYLGSLDPVRFAESNWVSIGWAHEMDHCDGATHHNEEPGIMNSSPSVIDFSKNEKIARTMVRKRLPGNRYEDTGPVR